MDKRHLKNQPSFSRMLHRNWVAQRILLCAMLAALCCAIIQCSSQSPVAGGTDTESGGVVVAGRFIAADSSAIPNAYISLYKTKPLPLNDNDAAALHTTRTNTQGAYRFDHVAPGNYRINGFSEDSNLVALIDSVAVETTDVSLAAYTASLPGALNGWIDIPTTHSLTLALYQTPYRASIMADGSFGIPLLPKGTYSLFTIVRNDTTDMSVIVSIDTVIIDGPTTLPDTIRTGQRGTKTVLLDDFEDGDELSMQGGQWWSWKYFANPDDPSEVTPSPGSGNLIVSPGAVASANCIHIGFTLGSQANVSSAGIGVDMGKNIDGIKECRNFSGAKGMSFYLKGTGTHVTAGLHSALNANYATFLDLPAAPLNWQRFAVDFATDIKDPGIWSAILPFITDISFGCDNAGGDTAGELWIDSVTVYY